MHFHLFPSQENKSPTGFTGEFVRRNGPMNGKMNAILVGPRRKACITYNVIQLALSNRNWHRTLIIICRQIIWLICSETKMVVIKQTIELFR